MEKTLEAGSHTIVVYGAEKYADGDFDVKFKKNSQDWK